MFRRTRRWLVVAVITAVGLVSVGHPAGAASGDEQLLDEIASCQGTKLPFEVFMKVDATDTQIADVRTALEHIPRVRITKVLSKDDAYAEFKRIFAKKPDLVNSITAADLPVSIRARVIGRSRLPKRLPEAVAALRALPGVDSVEKPGEAFCSLVNHLKKAGRSPKEIVGILRDEGLA